MSAQSANLDTMAELQGNHDSTMGQLLTPYILAALERAKLVTEDATDPQEVSLRETYLNATQHFNEAQTYFEEWLAADAPASSGVDTFYQQVTAEERRHSIATTSSMYGTAGCLSEHSTMSDLSGSGPASIPGDLAASCLVC